MTIIAVIPARGGSKAVPRKNVRQLCGKPLIAWTIEEALNTKLIERVFVSTDDDEIARISVDWGAEVVRRPTEISSDYARSELALEHTLTHLQEEQNIATSILVFLQATSPLRKPGDINTAIDQFKQEDADSLFSVAAVHGPIWQSTSHNLEPVGWEPRSRLMRQEQDVQVFEENGSLYILKPEVLQMYGARTGGKTLVFPMGRLESIQVDNENDLLLLEQLFPVVLSSRIKTDNTNRNELMSAVRLLALDFDGVMTDNRVLTTESGEEAVWCNRADGLGLEKVRNAGINILVISSETNPVVAARCKKLSIDCVHGIRNKLEVLESKAKKLGVSRESVAYIGNDLNDLDCLRWSGIPIAVADAIHEVKQASHLTTLKQGGDGAVREVADWITSSTRYP